MPLVRCLTESGIDEFRAYLVANNGVSDTQPPTWLLSDPVHSRNFDNADVSIERRGFGSRYDFASYIDEQVRVSGYEVTLEAPGLWEWLALFYFDQISPPGANGTRRIGKVERYIPDANRGWHYRHLLKGAYTYYREHSTYDIVVSRLALAGPVDQHGAAYEHLVSRPRLRSSFGAQQAAVLLYYDLDRGTAKGRITAGDAKVQEFGRVLRNLPPEYDLSTMSAESILALLPSEFSQWLDEGELAQVQSARDLFGIVGDPIADADPERVADQLSSVRSRRLTTRQVRMREDEFRKGVVGAYDFKCAISGMGLVHSDTGGTPRYEVDAAHIIPVRENGPDIVPNGMALAKTLHWAFDQGMIWIDGESRIRTMPEVERDRRNEWLRQYGGRRLSAPSSPKLAPDPAALRWHAKNVAGVKGV